MGEWEGGGVVIVTFEITETCKSYISRYQGAKNQIIRGPPP
jgi:hypothetical protein